MTELKRCPFCGEVPKCGVEFCESSGIEIMLAAVVHCPKCHIEKRVKFRATHPTSLVPFWDYVKSFDRVCEEWNERVG